MDSFDCGFNDKPRGHAQDFSVTKATQSEEVSSSPLRPFQHQHTLSVCLCLVDTKGHSFGISKVRTFPISNAVHCIDEHVMVQIDECEKRQPNEAQLSSTPMKRTRCGRR
jgi:hypothetical protein